MVDCARPALAQSARGFAVLPNPFAPTRGRATRARWLTGTGKQTAANGAITPYSYEATSHRLTQTGTEARTYDAVGNPISIGARQLTYDDRSRLTVFVNGTTTRRYQYTGQGLRVRKWTSSNTSGNTYFVYNENAQLIGEYDNAGARVQEILWLGNLPVGVIAGSAATPVLHYIESDHLGTPRVIVEATRNVGIWRWNQTNDPFGESTPNQNPDGDATSFTFNLRFAGQYRDSESGWYYNVHRYYEHRAVSGERSDWVGRWDQHLQLRWGGAADRGGSAWPEVVAVFARA